MVPSSRLDEITEVWLIFSVQIPILSNISINFSLIFLYFIKQENEHVLIRSKSLSAVCYKDSNDIQQTEDFDIIIIVSHINDNFDRTVNFQVYILITNKK